MQPMEKHYEIIDSYHNPRAKFEILQLNQSKYSDLRLSDTPLKQVRVKLNNGTVITEAGTLRTIQGQVRKRNIGIFRKMPSYEGSGELYLEPSPCHYMLHKLEEEEIIIDEGMFYCCESSIEVSTIKPSTSSSRLTKLKGSGVCVLQSPVAEEQILKFDLFNERLQIDQNCIILRSTSLQPTVDLSLKNLLQPSNLFNRNNCLQTFHGSGKLWIVPLRLAN